MATLKKTIVDSIISNFKPLAVREDRLKKLAEDTAEKVLEVEMFDGTTDISDVPDDELIRELAARMGSYRVADIMDVLKEADTDDLIEALESRSDIDEDRLLDLIGDDAKQGDWPVAFEKLNLSQREALREFLEQMFPAYNDQMEIINF